ncbi:MAG: hypothetical protein WBE72_21200 [Terracidiphilus sp.]
MSVQAAIATAYKRRASVHSITDIPAFAERLAETYESMGEGARCSRGALMAIALEAVAVLGGMMIWQFWHILR